MSILPKHVLFIGNSYTSYNGGLDHQLQGLAPGTVTASITASGYTLENHWKQGRALATIRKGGWDYVVLQEQSQRPLLQRELFAEYAQKFDSEIKKQNGFAILLMTWDHPESDLQGITAPYTSVGKQLGIKLAPVGLAFARSRALKPDLVLYQPDGHPTVNGTYLAALVLYETIYSVSPLNNPYSDSTTNPDTRAYLQQVALDTIGIQ